MRCSVTEAATTAQSESAFTLRTRRQPTSEAPPTRKSRFSVDPDRAAPAVVTVRPAPFGDLGAATVEEIVACSDQVGVPGVSTKKRQGQGVRFVLNWLQAFAGETWQERWIAAGLDESDCLLAHAIDADMPHGRYVSVNQAAAALFMMRVIRPNLKSLCAMSTKHKYYGEWFVAAQGDADLDRFSAAADRADVPRRLRDAARTDVALLMTSQGITFRDITAGAVLHYVTEWRSLPAELRRRGTAAYWPGVTAWDLLYEMGQFPKDAPPSLRASIYGGQKSPEEMVHRYAIRNAGMRQLLIDYLVRRQADTDYKTRDSLALQVAGNFWAKVEEVAPDQPDLHLSQEVYEQWRESIRVGRNGKARLNLDGTLLPVRAFYMDLQSWALEEPERWAQWAAPCPIPKADLRGYGKRRRQIKDRTDERIRLRQPLLHHLVAHVEDRMAFLVELLAETEKRALGETFVVGGKTYERTNTRNDRSNQAAGCRSVRVIDMGSGETLDVLRLEDRAFWQWAVVEVLRHSGIRIEELVELSHTSIRRYRRPNGEMVALLVIAPSKSDRERVIPCSAELFHVLALIVRRLTRNGDPIPTIARYDPHERVLTEPLPYLFQRQHGSTRMVMAPGSVVDSLNRACAGAAQTNRQFQDVVFTPHDFRRLFATDLIGRGLPIHIGAALLGHLNIETTRGYTGVFQEDVIKNYQRFLDNRRRSRPEDEYRKPTREEWTEFEEHFDKRKIELGSCERPYGSPCAHEHACVRCPMLQVDPKMLGRLEELEVDLVARLQRARTENWIGEIEGIETTLDLLQSKRDETKRHVRTAGRVSLGMPGIAPRSTLDLLTD